ncbi:hypothetical protein ASPZODRAFT_125140 [Penicilliopsis zonata CBS 506.65]|uniref:Uncharacterized protein n=1 Tax=Penicilliopsis zonata CBS 506.65 TaxID=1073090 RepID=A0A1L9S6F7_9EURO|nr:hypothetical protein ASPZODRAFT_125140 [Penicilliopsis zonata CBS 506.65]OJJ42725.1 hypothetical protein ASPZODRAFT_125140 [Penicilliopsis zonata CBS 506.65]
MGSNTQNPRPGHSNVSKKTGAHLILTDIAFRSVYPPDVCPRSRIVAVCGVSDVDDLASPHLDGWLFSDFYLLHHLLSLVYTHTSNQVWLTCLEPKYLVEKYTEYAHGDPRNDRRAVLDKDRLSDIELAANMHVVDQEILLERFVRTVEEQARYAKEYGETLLVLIFSRGNCGNFSVQIGGAQPDEDKCQLEIEDLKRVLPKGLDVTLMLTSCYSGGWLIQPNIHYHEHLNTGIAVSFETRSWSMGKSVGRACGSTVTSAIVDQLIKIEEAQDAEESAKSHLMYSELVSAIYDKATELDTFFKDQNIQFSTQDDDWESHWRPRTGTPLAKFKDHWEMLRQIPPSSVCVDHTTGGRHPTSTRRVGSLQNDLHRFAAEYFRAKPGRSGLSSNVALHSALYRFSQGFPEADDTEHLQSMLNQVIYRLNMMRDADEFVGAMGFEFPSCLGYSIQDDYKPSATSQAKRDVAWNHLKRVKLFPISAPYFTHFTKPQNYLAIVLAERCESTTAMKEKIAKALEWKEIKASQLLPNVQAYKIINDEQIRSKLHACYEGLREAGHRLYVRAGVLTRPCPHEFLDIPTFSTAKS